MKQHSSLIETAFRFVKLLLNIVSYSRFPLTKGCEKQKGQYRYGLTVLPHLYIKIDWNVDSPI